MRQFPPSLSSIKSEFEKLCDELGGPADIGVKVKKIHHEHSCKEYPSRLVLPTLLRFQSDENSARRHWPWAAFAVSQYAFERRERAKYTDELKPKEVSELLCQIGKAAHDLSSGLCTLQSMANRLADPTAKLRRAHLAWLDAFLSQAVGGRISNDVNGDGKQMLSDHFEKMNLLARLAAIEIASKEAMKRVDPTLLKRERGQVDPALPCFVFRCGGIWKSLTGRKPSAHKVHRRGGPTDPDFVVFVQGLAKLGGAPAPSRNHVATCLQNEKRDQHVPVEHSVRV
jgi:hypothetical protein